uniref:Uncharacterized protein n=1 Tax=Lotus japonicus TaxID=34305 RepID=I3T8R3_LOTJA|nr:unknown [Lotus japonicus]
MEPENIDWDTIESTFVEDDTYEDFDAPKWVDLSSLDDELLVDDDDEAWFCIHDCKHPKTAEDFLKPATTRNPKAKLLRFGSFSEILPFRDRLRRQNSSAVASSNFKTCEKSRRPSCSGSLNEESENRNPNFSAVKDNGGTKKMKKPLIPNGGNPKQLNGSTTKECPARSDRKPKLRSTFSAQNLLGGREILSQITGFCSELKRLARKGSKKGTSENAPRPNGVSEEEQKEKDEEKRERVPLLVLKKGTTLKS